MLSWNEQTGEEEQVPSGAQQIRPGYNQEDYDCDDEGQSFRPDSLWFVLGLLFAMPFIFLWEGIKKGLRRIGTALRILEEGA